MSLQDIHLRKIIKIMYLEGPSRVSALRTDIRETLARARGDGGGGGDFYGPFWRDAKDHVFNVTDLREQTRIRIKSNLGRAGLYNLLRDGFLLWWDRRRRWTNQPFFPAASLKATVRLPSIDSNIKLENILSVRDANGEDHFVYPYWFPEPTLTEEMARLALWALCQGFPTRAPEEFRVLDVIRGNTFSLERNPLQRNEGVIFQRRFNGAMDQWQTLRREYD